MSIFKRILIVGAAIIAAIVLIVLIDTVTLKTKQILVPRAERVKIDETGAIERLSKGLQIKTVSYDDPLKNDYSKFVEFRNYIDVQYPAIHKNLKRTIINDYSLLYEWKGINPDKKPIILLAHMDVVPENENKGKVDPFSGKIQDGYVWGRGALDDKGSLFSILESVEKLINLGFTPERTVYLAFGHDEEAGTTGGMKGAREIAEYLKNKGVHAEYVVDEGLTIVDEKLSPVKGKKFAMVGVAEKGFVTLKITAAGQGGHSSMPGKDTAITTLAKALTKLDRNKFPSSLKGTISLSLDYFGPEAPFYQKIVFSNRWLFDGIIKSALEKSDASAAMLHTTIAPTVIQGGTKEQTLPLTASVIINFRIIPGETSKDVINHVKNSISDPRIRVEQFGDVVHEPAPISNIDSDSFKIINKTVREVFPDVKVAPGLVTGRTDSVYFKDLVDNSYNFVPHIFGPEEISEVHGLDERVSIDSYLNMIQFYIRFIENSAGNMRQ